MEDITTGSAQPDNVSISRLQIEKDYFDHLKKVNDLFYDQVKISDQKAAYIFTFMLAFLVTSKEAKSAFTWQNYVDGSIPLAVCSALLAFFATFTMMCAIFAVLPRHFRKSTSLFWGAWPIHREAFRNAAEDGDNDYLFQQYMDNADILAALVRNKFRCVTMAFWGLAGTVLSYVCTLTFF